MWSNSWQLWWTIKKHLLNTCGEFFLMCSHTRLFWRLFFLAGHLERSEYACVWSNNLPRRLLRLCLQRRTCILLAWRLFRAHNNGPSRQLYRLFIIMHSRDSIPGRKSWIYIYTILYCCIMLGLCVGECCFACCLSDGLIFHAANRKAAKSARNIFYHLQFNGRFTVMPFAWLRCKADSIGKATASKIGLGHIPAPTLSSSNPQTLDMVAACDRVQPQIVIQIASLPESHAMIHSAWIKLNFHQAAH